MRRTSTMITRVAAVFALVGWSAVALTLGMSHHGGGRQYDTLGVPLPRALGRVVWVLAIPVWLATLAAVILAFAGLDRRRRRPSHDGPARPCTRCGYDLRATPDRCPECGTIVEA